MEAKRIIQETWGDGTLHRVIFDRIVERFQPSAVEYLPLSRLREILGEGEDDSEFDRVIYWFSSDALPLFEEWYELLTDQDGLEFDPISPVELRDALGAGQLTLSDGSIRCDFTDFIYPFFKGTKRLVDEIEYYRSKRK